MACVYCEDAFPIINEICLCVYIEEGELWADYYSDEDHDFTTHTPIEHCLKCGDKLGGDAS